VVVISFGFAIQHRSLSTPRGRRRVRACSSGMLIIVAAPKMLSSEMKMMWQI